MLSFSQSFFCPQTTTILFLLLKKIMKIIVKLTYTFVKQTVFIDEIVLLYCCILIILNDYTRLSTRNDDTYFSVNVNKRYDCNEYICSDHRKKNGVLPRKMLIFHRKHCELDSINRCFSTGSLYTHHAAPIFVHATS